MRKITGNIKILANENYANKKLQFILCGKYGYELSAFDVNGQIATKKTTQTNSDGSFSIDLYETEQDQLPMYYKMVFVDNEDIEDIKLFVRAGEKPIDFLSLLLPMPNLKMFYEIKNLKTEFDTNIVEIFERFFVHENIFVNNDEKNLLDEFVRYADNARDSNIMQELDKYLSTIKIIGENEDDK